MGNGNSIEDQQEGQPNNRSQAERGTCCTVGPSYVPVAEEKSSRTKKKMVDLSKEMTQLWDAIRPLAKQNNPPVADIAAAVTTRETSLLKSRENEAIVRLHIEQMEDLKLAKALGQKGFREYVKCRVNPPENRKQARLDRLNRYSREPGGAPAAEVFPGLIEEINQVDVASDPQGAVHRLAETVLAAEDRLRGRNELTELQKEQMRFMETEHVKPLLGGLFPVFQNVKSSIGRIRRLEQENADRGADYAGATSREEQHKILKDLEIELTSETFPRHDEYAFVRAVSYTEARLRGNKPLSPLLREQLHEIEDRIIRGQKLSKDSFKLYWKAKWPSLAFRSEAAPSQLAREDQMQVLAYLEKQIQDVKVTAENAGQALAVLHQAVKSAQDRLQQLSGSRVNELAKLQILEIEERVIKPKLGGDGYRSYKEKQDTGSRFAKEQDVLIRQLRETADDLQTKLRSKDLRDQTVVERLAKQVLTTRSELEALSEIKDSRNIDALLEAEERDFKGRFPQHVWQEYEKKKAGMLSQYQSAFVVLDNEIEKRLQSVTVIEAVAVDLVVAANACKQALRSMGLYLEQAHRRIIGLRIKSRVADSVVYKKFEELARLAEQFDETARKDEEERLKRFSDRSNGTPVMLLDPSAPRDAPRAEEGADPGSSFYFIYCCGSQNPNSRTATLREMEQDSNNRLFWIDCSKTDKKHSVVMQLMDGDKKTPIAITDPFPLEPMPVSVSHNVRMQGPKVRPSTLTYKGTVDATRDFDPKTGQPYSMQVNRRAMRKLFGEVVN